MDENRVVSLRQKGAIDDPLTEIRRAGARRLIAQAVEAEFVTFLASNAELVLSDGRRRVVRHGHDPVRAIQTGIEPVDVKSRRPAIGARHRRADTLHLEYPAQMGAAHEEPRRAAAGPLPAWNFRGRLSGSPFRIARQGGAQLVVGGDRAPQGRMGRRISPMAEARFIGAPIRLRLGGRRLFAGANGAAGRMHAGADRRDAGGQEGVDWLSDGMRESAQSWKELLVDLKARGLAVAPQAAIGDGALGFWKALDEAFPTTRHQRCWLHKTLNVLDKLPKSMQPNAHKDLREDLAVAEPGRGGSGDDDIRREIRAQIR